MKAKIITDKMKRDIISDHLAGIRLKDISDKYEILTPRIIRLLKNEGCFKPSTNRWTKSEIEYLKSNYPCSSWEEIEKNLPGRNKDDIFVKASKLGISRVETEFSMYSEYEDSIIRKYYISHGAKYISENILKHRTESSIKTRAQRIGISSKEFWSKEEETIMSEKYEILTVDGILKLLPNRTREAIISHAKVMGLKSPTNKKFSFSDDKYIIDHYLEMSDDELAKQLKRDR